MKTNLTTLYLGMLLFLVSCGKFSQPLPAATKAGQAATSTSWKVALQELSPASSQQQWEQFLKERGAAEFWQQLQGTVDTLNFRFATLTLDQAGIADEVATGIVRYLAYHHAQEVRYLELDGTSSKAHQRLTQLPAEIGQLTNLQGLDSDNNQLREIPAWISQLTSLEHLYLDRNQLQELPAEIGQLTSLQWLRLGSTQLQELPAELCELTSLQRLDLENNQLQELPAALGQLTSLQQLDLSFNQLPSLSEKLYARIEDGDLYVNSSGNPFLQASQLTPLKGNSLASYAYQGLPRSLRTLCAQYINNPPEYAFKATLFNSIARYLPAEIFNFFKPYISRLSPKFEEEHIANLLPQELAREGRETIIEQECQWPQQVQIVFFEDFDEGTLFHLDRQLCTSQDVKDLLEEFKDKQLYLVPKD